jgi:hypothetical protein
MNDAYADDLSDFIRNGILDGYELTDEELAHFLEVWRWSIWTRYGTPTSPDHVIDDATHRLQAHMAQHHHVDVDYNTLLLLRQELEPIIYLRVLWDFPRVVAYFLKPRNWLTLLRSITRARRYDRLYPINDPRTRRRGYPKHDLALTQERAPDLLRRKYWHRVAASMHELQKRPDYW